MCLFLDIIWEVRRKGKTRYKPLTQAECQALEDDYQVKKKSFAVSTYFDSFNALLWCKTKLQKVNQDIPRYSKVAFCLYL